MSDAHESSRPQLHGLEAWAPALCAVVGIGAACVFVAGGLDFCLDDAWIHASYAKSLLAGDGLSYNPGDHETGFSSPLWVALLAAWPRGVDPVVSTKMLGALLHGLTAWLSCSVAMHFAQRAATVAQPLPVASVGLFAGSLVAVHPVALQAAVSGMEVALASALVIALGLAALREQWSVAAVVAGAAVLARPELLVFAAVFALACMWAGHRPAWRIAAGALVAMLAWCAYCWGVSGHPLPNTFYVKTAGEGQNLRFVGERVLAREPWVVGVGGVLALLAALRFEHRAGRRMAWAWIAAWLACFAAIAVSRPLNPGVTFYETRYFAPLFAAPLVLVALGFARLPRAWALLAALPVFLVSGLWSAEQRELTLRQELDISLLHTQPARYLAETLPADTTLMVEGAGATRWFAPRPMRVLDALGLNFARVAHAKDDAAKVCVLAAEWPEYALLPDHIAAPLARVFAFRPVQSFVDPSYSIVTPPQPMRVTLYAIEGVQPSWQQRCGLARTPGTG